MAEIACFDSQELTVSHPAAAAAAAELTGMKSLLSCCHVMLMGSEIPRPRLSPADLVLLLLQFCCSPASVKTC